jgi:CHASE3 domain sensor protein
LRRAPHSPWQAAIVVLLPDEEPLPEPWSTHLQLISRNTGEKRQAQLDVRIALAQLEASERHALAAATQAEQANEFARRLTWATWVLAVATFALIAATILGAFIASS